MVSLPKMIYKQVGMYKPSLSSCMCRGKDRREKEMFLLMSALPLGYPWKRVRGSDLLVCHLLVGNPWYKVIYF